MVNIELQLIATILHTARFEPIIRGDFTAEDCLTAEGKSIMDFITTYRISTGGAARFPSLAIVQSRFKQSNFILPTPAPADTVEALTYEVKVQRARAQMKTAAQELLNGADSEDPLATVRKLHIELRDLGAETSRTGHVSLRGGLHDAFIDYANGNLIGTGIPWLWPSLQKETRGLQRKEFVIFSGRPKTRKTFVALAQATHGVMTGHRVLVFSPEMPKHQMFMRSVAMLAKVRYTEFKQSNLDDAEFMRFCELVEDFGDVQNISDDAYKIRVSRALAKHGVPDLQDIAIPSLEIVESANKPVSWLAAKIDEYTPDLVIADSLYRQSPDSQRKNGSEHERVASVSRACKDMAMTHNVAFIATHQINREGDKKVGDLTNVAMSDALSQDADLIIRIITGRLNGVDCSGLAVLGGRELPIEGVLIHNVPCSDFSEIAAITHKKQLEDLMVQEEERELEDASKELKKKAAAEAFGAGLGKSKFASMQGGDDVVKVAAEAESVQAKTAAFSSAAKVAAATKAKKAKKGMYKKKV